MTTEVKKFKGSVDLSTIASLVAAHVLRQAGVDEREIRYAGWAVTVDHVLVDGRLDSLKVEAWKPLDTEQTVILEPGDFNDLKVRVDELERLIHKLLLGQGPG